MLDEKFQRNASKFAIFYIYENPKLLFPFIISCYFIFLPNECPAWSIMANFEAFRWNFLMSINFEIGKSAWQVWDELNILSSRTCCHFGIAARRLSFNQWDLSSVHICQTFEMFSIYIVVVLFLFGATECKIVGKKNSIKNKDVFIIFEKYLHFLQLLPNTGLE